MISPTRPVEGSGWLPDLVFCILGVFPTLVTSTMTRLLAYLLEALGKSYH